jgi:glutathione S-transferase
MGTWMAFTLDLASSRAATWLRSPPGPREGALRRRPLETLVLYEFEACPFCRRVREAVDEIGLEVEIRPCPKGGTRFRPEVIARGGKAQFPYLVDPNSKRALYESAEIVRYLWSEYGASAAPRGEGAVAALAGSLASLLRGRRGHRVRPSRAPGAPLRLSASEASPEARLVREALCELELAYRLIPGGNATAPPRLEDPSGGAAVVGAAAIRSFLATHYASA